MFLPASKNTCLHGIPVVKHIRLSPDNLQVTGPPPGSVCSGRHVRSVSERHVLRTLYNSMVLHCSIIALAYGMDAGRVQSRPVKEFKRL